MINCIDYKYKKLFFYIFQFEYLTINSQKHLKVKKVKLV